MDGEFGIEMFGGVCGYVYFAPFSCIVIDFPYSSRYNGR